MQHKTCPRVRSCLRTKMGRTSSSRLDGAKISLYFFESHVAIMHLLGVQTCWGDIAGQHITSCQLQELLDGLIFALHLQPGSLELERNQPVHEGESSFFPMRQASPDSRG